MILVDANLLIYAWNSDAKAHQDARRWLEGRLSGIEGAGLPWASLVAFARIVSNPRIFTAPASIDDAWATIDEWLALPCTFVPEPTARHEEVVRHLLPGVSRPELVPDAHLAALAIEYGLVLQTPDGDFGRFPGLSWEDPLVA